MKKYIDLALKAYYIGKEIIINSFEVESFTLGKGFETIIISYCTKNPGISGRLIKMEIVKISSIEINLPEYDSDDTFLKIVVETVNESYNLEIGLSEEPNFVK